MTAPSRAEEVQQERRRRVGGAVAGLKLAVPEAMLDRKNFAYRWANDKDNRLSDLTTMDDYDIVKDEKGEPTTRNAGTNDGKPMKTYLLRKPRKYFEADQAEKLKPVDAMEDEIRRGGTAHLKGEDGADLSGVYTPGGRNTIDGR